MAARFLRCLLPVRRILTRRGSSPSPVTSTAIPFAYPYRGEKGATAETFRAYLEDAFKRSVAPESVAAVIAEPFLGKAALYPRARIFQVLQDICRKHGILFICGRSAIRLRAHRQMVRLEHFGIERISSPCEIPRWRHAHRRRDRPRGNHGCARPRALGGTYCGHPAFAPRRWPRSKRSRKRPAARSTLLRKHFELPRTRWQKKWPLVGDVRGLGGMCAIEWCADSQTREPGDSETKEIAKYCYEHGLITVTAGTFNNVIRILRAARGNRRSSSTRFLT